MALSVETVLTDAWVEVVADTADYVLQNNGNSPLFLFWKASAPASTDQGFKIMPGNGVDSVTFLAGPIYARVGKPSGAGRVVVNQ